MSKITVKKIILSSVILLMLSFGIASEAAQTDGYTRDITVTDITVSCGGRIISGVCSDPVDYYEIVRNNSLEDLMIIEDEISPTAPVIYTALYPYTSTGRKGDFTEYVCERSGSKYTVKSVNSSGDGMTYIPVGGFVLSLPDSVYPDFAKVGSEIKLGGSSLILPAKAIESSVGRRIAIDYANVKRTGPMIVYYGRDYGEKTGTNIYGTEMTCRYDFDKKTFIVTDFRDFLTGDDSGSEIPDNGFVMSAYGSGYRQLLAEDHLFSIGDEIKTVGFSFTATDVDMLNGIVRNLENRAEELISDAEALISQLYDINAELVGSTVSELKEQLSALCLIKDTIVEKNSVGALSAEEHTALMMEFDQGKILFEELCDKLLVASAESKVVSARSAWHRPCESTYSEIEATVETFKRIGMNLIFVETFYHGCSAFKSDLGEFPYHPSLASTYRDDRKGITYNDYLSAFVACCAEKGIEVHAWVENFYVGIDKNAAVLKNHPEWIVYNDDGSYLQRKEGGLYIFIDPASKEVQDTLIDYYNELFSKHPGISGLNLDYIRYPVSDRSQDTGYTADAMIGFYSSLGKEFSDSQLADRTKMANKFKQLFDKNYLSGGQTEADTNYQLWVEYRTSIITEFVRRIKNEVKEPNGIILSTAVFASISESINSKKADWYSWFNFGWIDIATPMAYYTSSSTVKVRVEEMIAMGGSNCLYYTGIASSYSGLPAWQNKEFIEASYEAGACGYVIFSSAQILGHTDVQLALDCGVNHKIAVLPHAAVKHILSACFSDIIDKADRLYVPAGGMTEEGRAELNALFDEILKSSGESSSGIYRAYLAVEGLLSGGLADLASGHSYNRIKEQLSELSDVLDARISIQLIKEEKWDPEAEPIRPEIEDDIIDPPVDPDDGEQNPDDGEQKPDDGEQKPDDGEQKPDDGEQKPDDGEQKPDDGENTTQEGEKIGWLARIIRAIAEFFKKIFGSLFG